MPKTESKFFTNVDKPLGRATVVRKDSKYGKLFSETRENANKNYGKENPEIPAKMRRAAADDHAAMVAGIEAVGDAAGARYAERSKYAKK